MAFDPTVVTDLTIKPDSANALVQWSTTAPGGTWFQIYVDLVLVHYTQDTFALLPHPPAGVEAQFVVGSVDDGEQTTDFSSTLTPIGNIVKLKWFGGTWEGANISGFHVYAATTSGGAVNYSTIIATIVAYPIGVSQDGWGLGGWGQGGWGQSSTQYQWISGRLPSGSWKFGVRPYDTAGNEGTTQEVTATIVAPPGPPGFNASNQRLTYNNFHISAGHVLANLNWLVP